MFFKFWTRPTVTVLGITFSFDNGLTRFELEMKVDSCRYPHMKQVLNPKIIDGSNKPMNSLGNKVLGMQISDRQSVFWA